MIKYAHIRLHSEIEKFKLNRPDCFTRYLNIYSIQKVDLKHDI